MADNVNRLLIVDEDRETCEFVDDAARSRAPSLQGDRLHLPAKRV
jgi:hypothetical protein